MEHFWDSFLSSLHPLGVHSLLVLGPDSRRVSAEIIFKARQRTNKKIK